MFSKHSHIQLFSTDLYSCYSLISRLTAIIPFSSMCYIQTYHHHHHHLSVHSITVIMSNTEPASQLTQRQAHDSLGIYIGHTSLNHPWLRNAQQYQRNLYIVEKYFQCATIPSLTMPVYRHSVSRCCLPKMRSSAKFRKKWIYSSSRSSEVIDLGANRRRICNFLLVISSNSGDILHRCWGLAWTARQVRKKPAYYAECYQVKTPKVDGVYTTCWSNYRARAGQWTCN